MSTELYIPDTEIPTTTAPEYEQLPQGTYPCRIFSIIDLGTQQPHVTFKKDNGDPQSPARQILISFETVDELDKTGKPFIVSKEYPYKISQEDAKLISGMTKLIKAINGNIENKNVFKLINKMCLVSTTINDTGWPKITSVTGLTKVYKDVEFQEFNAPQIFFIDHFVNCSSTFDSLKERVRDKITNSPEYKQLVLGEEA